jgi:predicted NodU family carbamoyl transferase
VKVLGVSGPPVDSAVCLVVDGVVRAAAQEERFSRRPHDGTLPIAALACCLEAAAIESMSEIDAVVFHETAHPAWLQEVLPEFPGRVTAVKAERSLWTTAAPSNAAAAINTALTIENVDLAADGAQRLYAALGPSYTSKEVRELLDRFDLPYELVDDVPKTIAGLAKDGYLVASVRGRMEFGDVSLGNRTVFALAHDTSAMRRIAALAPDGGGPVQLTSAIGSGTFLHRVDTALKAHLPGGTLGHAPFRTLDEPTVCSPIDAYRCMMRGGIDAVVIEDVLIRRSEQPAWPDLSDA